MNITLANALSQAPNAYDSDASLIAFGIVVVAVLIAAAIILITRK